MGGLALLVFIVLAIYIKRRRVRTLVRRDMTQAFRTDSAGLHPRSPRSLFRGSGGGL